ncbi:MAG: ABC transporter ATP-binding protein [Nitrososphaeria archaeon]|nr:ABC transporter ATP-binding protein [Nitrososphaeria archaeon]
MLLRVENLHVEVGGKLLLKGVDMEIGEGETHVLFGPNGSGKSSLVMALIGHPGYRVIDGRIFFKGVDVTEKPVDERVKMGMGVVFQNPPRLYGVKLRELINRIAGEGMREDGVLRLLDRLNISEELLERYVNVGFSGGEVKRCEIAQVLAMNPDVLILDEPDSGVDVENLELIGKELAKILEDRAALVITHHGYILRYLKPSKAHVMLQGRIVCDGDPDHILNQIMREGYRWCERCRLMRKS